MYVKYWSQYAAKHLNKEKWRRYNRLCALINNNVKITGLTEGEAYRFKIAFTECLGLSPVNMLINCRGVNSIGHETWDWVLVTAIVRTCVVDVPQCAVFAEFK